MGVSLADYFSGNMILMENQYRVGNIVRIGDIAGQVEDISLRMTVLRDLEGTAHFISHGQIQTVSNLTHGWSRVVLEIGRESRFRFRTARSTTAAWNPPAFSPPRMRWSTAGRRETPRPAWTPA